MRFGTEARDVTVDFPGPEHAQTSPVAKHRDHASAHPNELSRASGEAKVLTLFVNPVILFTTDYLPATYTQFHSDSAAVFHLQR